MQYFSFHQSLLYLAAAASCISIQVFIFLWKKLKNNKSEYRKSVRSQSNDVIQNDEGDSLKKLLQDMRELNSYLKVISKKDKELELNSYRNIIEDTKLFCTTLEEDNFLKLKILKELKVLEELIILKSYKL